MRQTPTKIPEPAELPSPLVLGKNAYLLHKVPALQHAVYLLLDGIFQLAPIVKNGDRTLSLPVDPNTLQRKFWQEVQAEISVYMAVSNDWDHGIENGTMTNGAVYSFRSSLSDHAYVLWDFDHFSAHSSPRLSLCSYLESSTAIPPMPELFSPHGKAKFHEVLDRFDGSNGSAFFTDVFAYTFQKKAADMTSYHARFMRNLESIRTAFE